MVVKRYSHLTEREKQIFSLIACGLSNKEIATRLGISTFTVQNHIQNLFRKLGCQNRVEAAIQFLEYRMLPDAEERTPYTNG